MAPAKKAPRKKPAKADDEPPFVKQASAADRKAALEAVLAQQGVEKVVKTAAPKQEATRDPHFVREAAPDARKAAVEQLVEEEGVTAILKKAPWKRGNVEAAAPAAPPTPAEPAPPESARARMTSTPLAPAAGRAQPRIVMLDTNALLMQFQFHVDIEREVRRILDFDYDIVIPGIVVMELERLSKQGTQKEQAESRLALELAKTFRVEKTEDDGDTAILRLADRLNAIVVTNDKRLRARLRAKDIPNIYMRSRAFLTLEGHIPGT